jgi:RNA polymerase sigma-70 factor, ECF subfamily
VNFPTNGLDERLEQHRVELTAFCGSMLGPSEAEDAVQETFLRAWLNIDRFEGRSSLLAWCYAIARNVCLDMLSARTRRAWPIDLRPGVELTAGHADTPIATTSVAPMVNGRVVADAGPEGAAIARETLRRAFVAALQHLTPKQRAVLILREGLRWQASEVAELLETSVASVNSALQRARATLEACDTNEAAAMASDAANAQLLTSYVDAFEHYDMEALTALLHRDAKRGSRSAPSRASRTRLARQRHRPPTRAVTSQALGRS